MIHFLTAFIALVLVAPSAGAQQAFSVSGRIQVHPPTTHRLAFEMMKKCTGLEGDFEEISWHIADAMVTRTEPTREAVGLYTYSNGPHIVLKKEHFFNLTAVSHEILHMLHDGHVPMDTADRCLIRWQSLIAVRPPDAR